MKQKLILVSVLCLLYSSSYAQKWALPSSKWKYITYTFGGLIDSVVWSVEKDTVVLNVNCKKLSCNHNVVAFTYLSGDTVYMIPPNIGGGSSISYFLPYYYFGANQGDHIYVQNIDYGCSGGTTYIVDTIERLIFGADTLKSYRLKENGYLQNYRFIEKIGAFTTWLGWLEGYIYPHHNCLDEAGFRFCNYGDSTIAGFWLYPTCNCYNIAHPALVSISPWDTAICGGQVTLKATTNRPGGTFKWSSNASTDSFIVVSPDSTQFYTVSYTLNGFTDSLTARIAVYPQPVANAGIDSTLCFFYNVHLALGDSPTASSGSGHYSYDWYPTHPNAFINTDSIANPSVVIYSSGTFIFNLTVTDLISRCKAHDTIRFILNPKPTVSISTTNQLLCLEQADTLTALGNPAGGIYHWSIPFSMDTPVIIIPKDSGQNIIVRYIINGCMDSAIVRLSFDTICYTGISTLGAPAPLHLYPNPSTGTFTLQSEGLIHQSYTIYDLLGQVIASDMITINNQTIQLEGLADGVYILEIKGTDRRLKFCIARE